MGHVAESIGQFATILLLVVVVIGVASLLSGCKNEVTTKWEQLPPRYKVTLYLTDGDTLNWVSDGRVSSYHAAGITFEVDGEPITITGTATAVAIGEEK